MYHTSKLEILSPNTVLQSPSLQMTEQDQEFHTS